jgi:2-methylisocitrate lyase-like PEP mutase family enzyme
MTLAAKARRLADLHRGPAPLRLLNAWDAGTARVFEAAGAPAIGTTSAGIAFALGRPDGGISRDEMLAAIARIAAAVDVPVTADLETGFGAAPADVAATVRGAIEAGAAGVNIEDAADDGGGLRPLDEAVARVAAARAAADDAGVPLFLNARTDVHWRGIGEPAERAELTTDRLRAYAAAGADGVFAPGVTARDAIAHLVGAVDRPLNVLASPALPGMAELAALGVARVSTGSGPSRAALGLARRIAGEVLGPGTYAAMTEGALPYGEANELLG